MGAVVLLLSAQYGIVFKRIGVYLYIVFIYDCTKIVQSYRIYNNTDKHAFYIIIMILSPCPLLPGAAPLSIYSNILILSERRSGLLLLWWRGDMSRERWRGERALSNVATVRGASDDGWVNVLLRMLRRPNSDPTLLEEPSVPGVECNVGVVGVSNARAPELPPLPPLLIMMIDETHT